ncbi:alpha/beta hydrolase-fold protein [Niveibacterium sp. 24ML]|uniref:carboxylesterase family protein n=1 Tax=Niveibacterium sp. 24ML TaxID=2985512 RepID=UPI00226E84BA|nr:PHB depolymerase family esterase [Niveibacterium sp. 24ML]MCX9155742.1 alpha/beta hydrolase-fold protein [Niveibacterium sp. 24ML]
MCIASRWVAPLLCSLLVACGGNDAVEPTPAPDPSASYQMIESKVTALPAEELTEFSDKEYLLYLPAGYESSDDKQWPLIVFLHGSAPDSNGKDMTMLRNDGLMYAINKSGVRPAAIVVAPLAKNGAFFRRDAVDAAIRDVQARYKVDPERVSLTGMSLGGITAWNISLSYPYRFAAVAPVAGGLSTEVANRYIYDDAFWGGAFKALAATPFKVFHGSNDEAVPIAYAEHAVRLLTAAGGQVDFQRASTNHIGTAGFAFTQQLADWLISQQRSNANSSHPPIDRPERYVGRFVSYQYDRTGRVESWGEFRADTTGTLRQTGEDWGVAPWQLMHLGDSRFMDPFGTVYWLGKPDPVSEQIQCRYMLDQPFGNYGSYGIEGTPRLGSGVQC